MLDPTELIILVVEDEDSGVRIDQFVTSHTPDQITRSRIQKLLADGCVLVNDKVPSKSYKVSVSDRVKLTIKPEPVMALVPENIRLDIVFEDEHLAVVNKPAGLVTHPGAGNRNGTLVNGLLYYFKNLSTIGDSERPGIVHRLDKDTSGLLLVARSDAAYLKLQAAIQSRLVKRTYLALVCGHLKEERDTIDLPIGRSRRDRKKMIVNGLEAREAVTEYNLMKRFRSYDLLEVALQTGRTHQIRVHFSHLGHPVFGDRDYGGREKWLKGMFAPERPMGNKMLSVLQRQALHARRLEFNHPISGKEIKLEAAIPEDFQAVLDLLEGEGA